jgi:DNA-directed RNA polymerase specialized sigma24 family protein
LRLTAPLLSITLEIASGHATVTAVDGMAFTGSDLLHACVREQLAGLRFPRPAAPATFTLTISLKDPVAPFILAKRTPRVDRFGELDDILRTHSTVPVDLHHPLVRGDLARLNVLLLELKRTCLLTTLRGLTFGRRAVFILLHVLGLSVETRAEVCGTTPNGIRVSDVRGRQDLENYLGVRCEHLYAANPCHCAARLGNAATASSPGQSMSTRAASRVAAASPRRLSAR